MLVLIDLGEIQQTRYPIGVSRSQGSFPNAQRPLRGILSLFVIFLGGPEVDGSRSVARGNRLLTRAAPIGRPAHGHSLAVGTLNGANPSQTRGFS